MDCKDFLLKGAQILDQRGKTYDPAQGQERSMKKIVKAFEAITGVKLTEAQGWEFMACVKQVRAFQRPEYHEDSWQDFVNYAALGAEAASEADGKILKRAVKPEMETPTLWNQNLTEMERTAWGIYSDHQTAKGYNVQHWEMLDLHDKNRWMDVARDSTEPEVQPFS